jgi:hypothetical protein
MWRQASGVALQTRPGALCGNYVGFIAGRGDRVAVATPEGTAEAPKQDHEIVMLRNFADELQRKVR